MNYFCDICKKIVVEYTPRFEKNIIRKHECVSVRPNLRRFFKEGVTEKQIMDALRGE